MGYNRSGGVTIVTGLDELLSQLDEMGGSAGRAGAKGLKRAAEAILQDADPPVDTGALRDSGHVVDDEDELKIVYDVPYAAIVHEKMSLQHPTGEAKYLENAVNRGLEDLAATLAEAVVEDFEGVL